LSGVVSIFKPRAGSAMLHPVGTLRPRMSVEAVCVMRLSADAISLERRPARSSSEKIVMAVFLAEPVQHFFRRCSGEVHTSSPRFDPTRAAGCLHSRSIQACPVTATGLSSLVMLPVALK